MTPLDDSGPTFYTPHVVSKLDSEGTGQGDSRDRVGGTKQQEIFALRTEREEEIYKI